MTGRSRYPIRQTGRSPYPIRQTGRNLFALVRRRVGDGPRTRAP